MKRAALALLVLALLAPSHAAAQRQVASLEMTNPRPDSPTGVELRVDYVNPDDPAAKPPAVRTVVLALARGARFDTAAPALCGASDLELMALGAAACPEESIVGSGEITLDTGVPGARMIASEITFLNNTEELIFLASAPPLPAQLVIRAQVSGRQSVTRAPFLPGAPPDGAAIDTVRVGLERMVTERGAYVTTPPRCPRSRRWRNRITFTYDGGVTESVVSRQRCRR